MIASIDKVAQRMRFVKTKHKVGKVFGLAEVSVLIVRLGKASNISIYFNHNILVVFVVGVMTQFLMNGGS